MADVKFAILVLKSGAMELGEADATVAGLRQKAISIPWQDVAHFKIIDTTSEQTPTKGALGLVAGAAAGSLLGPVGAVAGLVLGASAFGSRRLKAARLHCGRFGELEFRCQAKAMKTIEAWWREHRNSLP